MGQVIVLLIGHCIWHGLNDNFPQNDLTWSGPICVCCPQLIHAGEKETEERRELRKAARKWGLRTLGGKGAEEITGDEINQACPGRTVIFIVFHATCEMLLAIDDVSAVGGGTE